MAYFNPNTWTTPNSYDPGSADPKGSGVYLLCQRRLGVYYGTKRNRYKILYVGQSRNLASRLSGHEVLRELQERFDDVVIFFRNHSSRLKERELELIRHFNPPYNVIGRKRGL